VRFVAPIWLAREYYDAGCHTVNFVLRDDAAGRYSLKLRLWTFMLGSL
jgi:hypothetical protein